MIHYNSNRQNLYNNTSDVGSCVADIFNTDLDKMKECSKIK